MKTVVVAALALLAGLFLGGLRPRAEVRAVQKELAQAKEAARGGSAAGLPLALGLGSLVAARDRARSVPRFLAPDGGADEPARGDGGQRRHGSMFGQGSGERFSAIKAAADVRAAQFRAAFAEQAGLSPESGNALDRAIDTMNQEFAKVADEMAESLRTRPTGGKVRPREMADIGARLLDVYRRADDGFAASLDEEGRAARARTEFDLLTQVDLGVFRKLAETLETDGVTRIGPP